jgi:hypothetical protein
MLAGHKFLRVAVDMGVISDQTRSSVLQQQENDKLMRHPHRPVGEIMCELGYATADRLAEIVREQEERRRRGSGWFRRAFHREGPLQIPELATAALAVVAVGVLWKRFGFHLSDAVQIGVFLSYLCSVAVASVRLGELISALYRTTRIYLVLVVPVLGLIAVGQLHTLKGAVPPKGHPDVLSMFGRLQVLAIVGSIVILGLAAHAVWAARALRFAQARTGAVKDVLIRVQKILGDASRPEEERRNEATRLTLDSLRAMIPLHTWDWVRRLVFLNRPSAVATSVVLLVPTSEAALPQNASKTIPISAAEPRDIRSFSAVASSYPPDTPQDVRVELVGVEREYRPVSLDEARFNERKKDAKGANPKGWRERFLNFTDRHEFVSAAGWVYAKRVFLVSPDAAKCLAFDNSHYEQLVKKGIPSSSLRWTRVRSFIACPVTSRSGSVLAVLLVYKNVRSGFVPEDQECVIAATGILSRIWESVPVTSGG